MKMINKAVRNPVQPLMTLQYILFRYIKLFITYPSLIDNRARIQEFIVLGKEEKSLNYRVMDCESKRKCRLKRVNFGRTTSKSQKLRIF